MLHIIYSDRVKTVQDLQEGDTICYKDKPLHMAAVSVEEDEVHVLDACTGETIVFPLGIEFKLISEIHVGKC